MQFLIYHVYPKDNASFRATIGGAYVHCWINRDDLTAAEQIARSELDQAEWVVASLEHCEHVSHDRRPEEPEALACYEQAKQGEPAFVVHAWPNEDD
ncbi:MAG: hypothetical protein SVU69_00875 [Pseudomonadota bacterium]|nr:hypothetical protein [Pseudomonadota bacterium]